MIKLNDLVKTFLTRLYILLIVFLLILGIVSIYNYKVGNSSLIAKAAYKSESQLAISSETVIQMGNMEGYMSNIIYRSKNGAFLNVVENNIKKELSNQDGMFKDFDENELKKLSNLTATTINNNFEIKVIEKTYIFSIEYSDSNAKVAQGVNFIIIESMWNILDSGDIENILGGASTITGADLIYTINKPASLPKDLSIPTINPTTNKTIFKVFFISFIIYVVIVIIYDYAIGYITNKHKAKSLIMSEIISEIEIPYMKYRKNSDEIKSSEENWYDKQEFEQK